MRFSREPDRADIHPVLERVVVNAIFGVAAAAVSALVGEQRKGISTGDRVIVGDEVRAQRALAAHGQRAKGRRTQAEIGGVVEHLAGLGRIAERVLLLAVSPLFCATEPMPLEFIRLPDQTAFAG